MSTSALIQKELRALGNRDIAMHSQRFFKTARGQYGQGDRFLGVRVPLLRKLARRHRGLSSEECLRLLQSAFHEERLLALFLLVDLFSRGSSNTQKIVYDLYRENTRFVNNWDLVDCSAQHIVGAYLHSRDRQPLYNLARSPLLWERRIAVMATFYFIKLDDYNDTLTIAAMLLQDPEDLIHKAVGWMLREIGKRDVKLEQDFLDKHCKKMPRIMLRYAIEKFTDTKRKKYLRGEV